MLDKLYKQNNQEDELYVTTDEFDTVIDALTEELAKIKYLDVDALITGAVLEKVTKLATPVKGVHYRDGKDGEPGKNGKDGTELTGAEIAERLAPEVDSLLIPQSSIKGFDTVVDTINDLSSYAAQLGDFAQSSREEYIKLGDKIKAIDIKFKRKKDVFVESVVLNGTDLVTTLNDETVITTDLSSLVTGGAVIVSTDAGNDITAGTDGGAYFSENVTALSFSSDILSFIDEEGNTTNIDLSAYNSTTTTLPATSITYDNTTSGLAATQVQAAIDEIDGIIDTLPSTDTYVASGALIASNDTLRLTLNDASIVDIDVSALNLPTAAGISYDNTISGLTATDVQDAIDELALGVTYTASEGIRNNSNNFELGGTTVAEAKTFGFSANRYICTRGDGWSLGNFAMLDFHTSTADPFASGSAGNSTVIGGHSHVISAGGNSAIIGGSNNTVTGTVGFVFGGLSNTAGQSSAIMGGQHNTASGVRSVVAGGKNNDASGLNSFIGGGGGTGTTAIEGNEASGQSSAVVGGNLNIASGSYSAIVAGGSSISRGHYSLVTGLSNTSETIGENVFGMYAENIAPTFPSGVHNSAKTWHGTDYSLRVGIGQDSSTRQDGFRVQKSGTLHAPNLSTFADNASALGGGLIVGDIYKTATGELRIVV